jgi:hypothetical protein
MQQSRNTVNVVLDFRSSGEYIKEINDCNVIIINKQDQCSK